MAWNKHQELGTTKLTPICLIKDLNAAVMSPHCTQNRSAGKDFDCFHLCWWYNLHKKFGVWWSQISYGERVWNDQSWSNEVFSRVGNWTIQSRNFYVSTKLFPWYLVKIQNVQLQANKHTNCSWNQIKQRWSKSNNEFYFVQIACKQLNVLNNNKLWHNVFS